MMGGVGGGGGRGTGINDVGQKGEDDCKSVVPTSRIFGHITKTLQIITKIPL
jgi:hypothetical protein